MKSAPTIHLPDVQAVYSGPEGRLWELLMGEQIHLGGFQSSMDLAQRAGIAAGWQGVDLCCCTGAGMRFLVRFCQVARMVGVDATPSMVELGRRRCADEGLAGRIAFVQANACSTGLPSGQFDFVWGEDAWCYVEDKAKLIAEAEHKSGLKFSGVDLGGWYAINSRITAYANVENALNDHYNEVVGYPALTANFRAGVRLRIGGD